MRYQLEVPILEHKQLSEFEFELKLKAPEIARESKPGQFMQILYDNSFNPFTRRPFSVYRVDKEAGTFSIVYLARGIFTQGLRNKQVGQTLSVVGPLGKQFEPSKSADIHVLIAGGVGAPPLYFLAESMVHGGIAPSNIFVINGARTKSLLVGIEEFEALGVPLTFTTDDGSIGHRGVVTEPLLAILNENSNAKIQVYTCGPTPMLKAVGDLCIRQKTPCLVSVETMMPCGLGVCMGCVVKINSDTSESGFNYLRSCYEGPVFDVHEVIWE